MLYLRLWEWSNDTLLLIGNHKIDVESRQKLVAQIAKKSIDKIGNLSYHNCTKNYCFDTPRKTRIILLIMEYNFMVGYET